LLLKETFQTCRFLSDQVTGFHSVSCTPSPAPSTVGFDLWLQGKAKARLDEFVSLFYLTADGRVRSAVTISPLFISQEIYLSVLLPPYWPSFFFFFAVKLSSFLLHIIYEKSDFFTLHLSQFLFIYEVKVQ
jgi:hypothetical protein